MLRKVFQTIAWGLSVLFGVLILLFQEFFIELARQFGAYTDPSGRVVRIMIDIAGVVNSYPFHALFWITLGCALGASTDWFLSKKHPAHFIAKLTRKRSPNEAVDERRPLEIIEDATFDHKTVGIDGKHVINCHFKGGSTLGYNGGRFRINACSRDSSRLVLASTSREVAATVSLLDTLGMLPAGGESSQIDLALLDNPKA